MTDRRGRYRAGLVSIAAAMTGLASIALAQDHEHIEGMAADHLHGEMLMVPADVAPTVAMTMNPDLTGGWHIAIESENFTFAPQNADREHVLGEGHAHIYVDGEKVDRVYGPDFYLGPLAEGSHLVEVTLNTNDHRVYGTEMGQAATAGYLVMAPPMGDVFPAITERFAADIAGGVLTNLDETIVVPAGVGVAITWHSDTALALHLHGYDLEGAVAPAQSLTMLFISSIPGRFPVETHGADTEAPVLFIEVRP